MLRLLFAAVLIAGALAVGVAAAADRPPNVVILLADDAGYADFSLHGKAAFPTPRIDSIAAHGVRCTDGYVSGCVCSPTRAGLLTGRYQQRFGHETNIPPAYSETNGLPLGERTFADRMRAGGFRTIALGKWHLGYADPFHPLARGFDDYYGFLQGARSYFPLEKPSRLNRLLRDREPVPEAFAYMTDELGREAAARIAANRDRPFFMYVAFNAVHAPNDALEKDLAAARAAGADRPQVAAMTIALDRAVGTVLDALDDHGLTDDTLVVFLNDNGGAIGRDNGDLRGRKGSLWEGGIRVPFVMQWPRRLPRGKVVEAPVIALDLLPTALAAAGIRADGPPLDGVNLLPIVTGEAEQPPPRPLFWRAGRQWAVRDGGLKLVRVEDGPPLLFDLGVDRGEQQDLAGARPADAARLRGLYEAWESGMREPIEWDAGAGEDRPRRRRKASAAL